MFSLMKSLAETVSNLSSQVNSIVSRPYPINPSDSPNTVLPPRDVLFAKFREFEERKKRVASLIVRGLRVKFLDVYDFMMESMPNLSNVACLNIEKDLFRLDVRTRNIKSAILFNANNLKNHFIRGNIFMSRDLAYSQRQELN